MNRRLRTLLGRLGLPDADAPNLWRRTVMFKNYGSIPMPPGASPAAADRGFMLLIVDQRGHPRHFAKCRPDRDPAFKRECRILDRLVGEPDLEGYLVRARSGRSAPLRLHLSAYLDEPRYDDVVPDQDPNEWLRCARAAVEAAGRVCRAAAERVQDLAPDHETVRPGRILEGRVRRLEETGVDADMLDRIAGVLGDVELPSEVQHGDLWPGNAFTTGDGTPRRLVDLERLGVVEVPLYDLFQWLWSSGWLLDRGDRGPWLPLDGRAGGAANGGGPWKRAAREVVWDEARRIGLDEEEVGAALLFSVVEMAAHRRRPGVPQSYARPLLQDLERLDRRLQEGAGLADLVTRPFASVA